MEHFSFLLLRDCKALAPMRLKPFRKQVWRQYCTGKHSFYCPSHFAFRNFIPTVFSDYSYLISYLVNSKLHCVAVTLGLIFGELHRKSTHLDLTSIGGASLLFIFWSKLACPLSHLHRQPLGLLLLVLYSSSRVLASNSFGAGEGGFISALVSYLRYDFRNN